MASLSQINIKFKADLSGFSTEMQNVGRQMERTGAKLQDTGSKMTLALSAPLGILGGLALKTAADFETMRTSLLSTFQGNQQAADEAFKSIQKFAESTPFQMEEVLEAFIKLKNMGLDPSEEALTSYGNTASAMGKSLNQMIEAVADAATGEFERLKEFGIKSKSEGDKVSFTFQGVTTTVAKNSEEIQKYLLGIGNVNFAGGMERQSQTFNGIYSSFKDSIASLADSFGTIMLEFFKPMLVSLKNMADGFKTLSPEVKKTIVIVGGLVAVVGPLLAGIGLVTAAIPTMVAGFVAIKTAVLAVTAVIAANPLGAIAVAVGAVALAFRVFSASARELTHEQKVMNGVVDLATQKMKSEKDALMAMVSEARNANTTNERRAELIKQINALSPELLGNINAENIGTQETTKAVNAYVEALMRKYKAQAAEEKLAEIGAKRLDLELKSLAVKEQLAKVDLNSGMLASTKNTIVAKGVEYLQNQFKQLEEEERILKSIIQNYDMVGGKIEENTQKTVANGEAVKRVAMSMANTQITPASANIEPIAPVSTAEITDYVDQYELEAMRLQLINQQLTEGISQIYTRAANDIAVGLGELIGSASSIGGFVQGMGQLLLGSFGDILIEFGKLAIQTGIGIETVKTALASFSGVGAIAIGVGLVALGSFVKSQSKEIANAPRFETGGVVGGSSYYGDKILARVNSGELILNDKQQRRLSGMMDSANNAINVVLGGGFEVSGDKLRLVLDRSNEKKKRLK